MVECFKGEKKESINMETKNLKRKTGPKVLLLPVTTRCNAKCVMCTIWKQESKSISSEFLSKAFEDGVLVSDLEYLGVTGGEPTLLPDLPDIVDFIIGKSKCLKEVSFNTNGLLTDNVLKIVKSLISITKENGIKLSVYVSLDGSGEIHDRVRGINGFFEKTTATIKGIKEITENEETVELSLNSVVNALNADHVLDTFKFAKSIEVPINFSLVMRTTTCINSANSESDFEILPEQKSKLKKFFSKMKMISRVNGENSLEHNYYKHVIGMLNSEPRQLVCPFADGEGCLIDPFGNVYPCGVSSELLMGNLFEMPFEKIWFNDDFQNNLSKRLQKFCVDCESNCFIHAAKQ